MSRTNPRLISTFETAHENMSASNSSDIIFLMNQKDWSKDKLRVLLGKNLEDVYNEKIYASRVTGNNIMDGTEF